MHRPDYVEDVVRAALTDWNLRKNCLHMVLEACNEFKAHHLEYQRHLSETWPDRDDDLEKCRISLYRLHSIAQDIHFRTNPGSHENTLDSIVYCYLRVVLSPLIEAAVVGTLRRGYHELLVSYDASRFTPERIDEFCQQSFAADEILSQIRSHVSFFDGNTEDVVTVLEDLL